MSTVVPLAIAQSKYPELMSSLAALPEAEKIATTRHLARTDLYFLIRYLFNRPDFDHPWLYDRCIEYQQDPYGYLDLWARDHRKSTIITYAHTIQEILASHGDDPLMEEAVTCGIFSHTRPIAKAFLRQIKRELEGNEHLINLFPDILYEKPDRDAPTWSEDSGLVVRRDGNPKEATVEAHGLVDGMPTGKHFNRLIYDDVVTLKSVSSADMIKKTTDAWALSLNLGTEHGKRKTIGTRYHYNDSYREMVARGAVKERIISGTEDGTLDGVPVLLSQEKWNEKVREMGSYVAACQLLNNPQADGSQGFKRDWLKYYEYDNATGMNIYLLCDPANGKKKDNDYTVMAVIGLASDENYYLLDMIRDRLSLTERGDAYMHLHRKWKPNRCGYEQYGLQADIDYIKTLQTAQNYRFEITPLGGSMAKADRINKLVPLFEFGRFYLPHFIHMTNYEGISVELIEIFLIEEYDPWPVAVHEDMLDCLARITDPALNAIFPKTPEYKEERYSRKRRRASSWMTR